MSDSANNISEQLVLYLDGTLDEADKKAVQDLLASQHAAQAEFEDLLFIRAAVRHYGFTHQVAHVHKEMMTEMYLPVQKPNLVKKLIRYSLAIAASLLFLVGGYWAYTFFTLSPDKVFSSNYKTYELSITRDGINKSTPVEKAYREKNYQEVQRIHDAKEDKSAMAEFLTGTASLEMKNNTKAIKCFNEVIDMNKGAAVAVLNDESEYYLALAYINNKDYNFALPLLNKINDDKKHKYNSEISCRLIRQVKMLKSR